MREPDLTEMYDRLYARFGPRHWWPAVGAGNTADTWDWTAAAVAEAAGPPPPAPAPPFEMIVGAILTQNVAWSNVEKALLNLRGAGMLAPAPLWQAPLAEVEQWIRPTGYYRQKALKLKHFLAHLFEQYGGDLDALLTRPAEELRVELLTLNGIGPETCDCILCYAAGYPVMPMDAYTKRIYTRVGIFGPTAGYAEMQRYFHDRLFGWSAAKIGDYHAQIDTLGARICIKRSPRCAECPLEPLCKKIGVGDGRADHLQG